MPDHLHEDPSAAGLAGSRLEFDTSLLSHIQPDAASGETASEHGWSGKAALPPGYGGSYGGAAYGAASEGEVHLMDYVRVVYKRRWTAITAFVVIFGTVMLYTLTATPLYEARAQVLI